jgi:CRP-like cAMP-binding protein
MFEATPPTTRIENSILAALPAEEYERIASSLSTVSFDLGQIIYEPDEVICQVYFPTTTITSLVTILEDGSTVEAGIIGYTGMVGIPVVLGVESSNSQAITQHKGDALGMSVDILKQELSRGGQLQQLLLRFTHALFTQVSQTAACNRLHTVEERLARWLLMIHDRIREDDFLLTQEFIATMLGSRRAGVTVAAGILQQAGLINYKRGRICIIDRERLEEVSCECYRIVKEEYDCYLGA